MALAYCHDHGVAHRASAEGACGSAEAVVVPGGMLNGEWGDGRYLDVKPS